MDVWRMPIWFGLAGAALKIALIAGLRTTGQHAFFALSVLADPISTWLADKGVGVLFDQRRIWPTPAEALAYEVFLVIGFAGQCAALGALCEVVARRLRAASRRRSSDSP
jgi:hypothetical protein